jgi:hypothetical protein
MWPNHRILPRNRSVGRAGKRLTKLHVPCFFSIAALLGVLAGCQTTTALTWQLPQGVKTTEINGYPMAYAEQGSGPTVVLVHGAMCDYRCWSPSMPALSKNYRVVSVSLRHHYPVERLGRDVLAGAARQGPERPRRDAVAAGSYRWPLLRRDGCLRDGSPAS